MRRAAILALVALVAGAWFTASAPRSVAASPAPAIDLSSTKFAPGDSIAITGTHWPQGTTLQAMLCGAEAVDGSVDCVQRAAVTMTPGPDGALQGVLHVYAPPRPCPCVVLVSGLSSSYAQRIPVEVVGVPVAPVSSAAPQSKPLTLEVQVSVSGGTSVASLFGGPAKRVLTVTLRNTGTVAIPHPVVAARWGRGGAPTHAITSRVLAALPPDTRRTVQLPFELDPLSIGRYHVRGVVTGATKPVGFEAQTSTYPWGLFAIGLVLLQVVLLALRNRARRRLTAREVAARLAALDVLAAATTDTDDTADTADATATRVATARGVGLEPVATSGRLASADQSTFRPSRDDTAPISWRAPVDPPP